jgi:hypothetical protein
MSEEFYFPPELAQYLGLMVIALERMRKRGTGPAFYRVGGGCTRSRIGYRKADSRNLALGAAGSAQ